MFTLKTYYELYIFHNVKFVCLLHLVCTIHRNNNVAMMAAATCGIKVTCSSEINISLWTETRACKYLIITIDGADLFVIGGSCTASTVQTSAAMWEDIFDCRSNPNTPKPDFRGAHREKRKQIATHLLSFSSYLFASFWKDDLDTWPRIWKDD